MHSRASILVLGLVVAIGGSSACKDAPAPTPAPATPPAEATPAPAEPPPPPTPPATPEAVTKALEEIRVRQRCNRIMGCDPAVALMQHGAAAVGPIVAAVDASGPMDGYWVVKLVDLLGQLGDPAALPTLHARLEDRRWEARAMAALSLARLASPESRDPLLTAHAALVGGKDPASVAAVRFALSALRVKVDERDARAVLAEQLGYEPEALAKLNPGFYAFMNRLVREARVHEALPMVRLGAIHRDRFVRTEALRTIAALRDTGGIPHAVTRLDDELPSVRRLALSALQAVTGSRDLDTPEAWKRWCEQRGCLAPLRSVEKERDG